MYIYIDTYYIYIYTYIYIYIYIYIRIILCIIYYVIYIHVCIHSLPDFPYHNHNQIFRIENANQYIVPFRLSSCQTILICYCLFIDFILFYVEVLVIIQTIIFLYVWPRRVKSKTLIKTQSIYSVF